MPLLNIFVFEPEGLSITTGAFSREDLFYSPRGVFILTVVQNSVLLWLLHIRVRRMGGRTFGELGVKFGELKKHIPAGIGFGLLILFAVLTISAVFTAAGMEAEQRYGTPGSAAELALVLTAAVLIAPVGEEVFFRAYIISALSRRYNRPFIYFFSAGLFALLHFDLVSLIPIFIFGVLMAFVFEKYNNVVPCVIVHGMNNFVAVMLLYAYG